MAEEFNSHAHVPVQMREDYKRVLQGIPVVYEHHEDLKLRVPKAIGLIRTADKTWYGNVILEAAGSEAL